MKIGYEEFRTLVDAAVTAKVAATYQSYEAVQDAVKTCFAGATPRRRAGDLMTQLMLRHVAEGSELHPYADVAQVIAYSFQHETPGEPSPEEWASAVSIVVAHMEIMYVHDDTISRRLLARAVAVGESVKELRSAGYTLHLNDDGKVWTDEAPLAKLIADIDGLAARVGGITIIDRVLKALNDEGRYDDHLDRFVITRDVSQLGQESPLPQTPWGYVFQLGVKHLASRGVGTSRDFEQLIRLCRLAVALMDVQPYSGVHGLFLASSTIVKFLQDSVIFDALFTLQQMPATDCNLQISAMAREGLLSEKSVGGAPLSDLPAVARCLLAKSKPRSTTFVTAAEIGRELRKSAHNVKAMLDQILAHATPPNQDLVFPPMKNTMGYHGRPLVAMPDGRYWCPPRSIAAKAMFDAVMQAVRDINKIVDSQFGKVLERMLVEQAAGHGMEIKSGVYFVQSSKSADGDCDLVIETPKEIVFIEVKKKTLTYDAQSGADLQLVLDLANGVAKSQAQALRHEHFVRGAPLTLKAKGRPDQVLTHAGRRVLRVSVVSFDYGSLHERNTIQKFLHIASTARVEVKDPSMQQAADEVNKAFLELRNAAVLVGELDKEMPFFDSVLLSIPQLLVLLRASTSNVSFVEELTRYERMSFTAKDWYYHWQVSRRDWQRPTRTT